MGTKNGEGRAVTKEEQQERVDMIIRMFHEKQRTFKHVQALAEQMDWGVKKRQLYHLYNKAKQQYTDEGLFFISRLQEGKAILADLEAMRERALDNNDDETLLKVLDKRMKLLNLEDVDYFPDEAENVALKSKEQRIEVKIHSLEELLGKTKNDELEKPKKI